jgi:hypothetical protein
MKGDRIEYDREFVKPVSIPGARVRIGYSRDRDEITAFVVQLEFQLTDDGAAGEAGEWVEVVRSDHDSTAEGGHDVTREGLHLDVYRDGEKGHSESLMGPLPSDVGFNEAEERITDRAERYVERFREWHRNNRNGSGRPNGPSK